jgi:hypothetical protein
VATAAVVEEEEEEEEEAAVLLVARACDCVGAGGGGGDKGGVGGGWDSSNKEAAAAVVGEMSKASVTLFTSITSITHTTYLLSKAAQGKKAEFFSDLKVAESSPAKLDGGSKCHPRSRSSKSSTSQKPTILPNAASLPPLLPCCLEPARNFSFSSSDHNSVPSPPLS